MIDWENGKCLLCGADAKTHVYDGPRGEKIDECAGGCPPYAIDGFAHEQIRLFVKEPAQRAEIIKFLKAEFATGKYGNTFIPITMDDLRKIGLIS